MHAWGVDGCRAGWFYIRFGDGDPIFGVVQRPPDGDRLLAEGRGGLDHRGRFSGVVSRDPLRLPAGVDRVRLLPSPTRDLGGITVESGSERVGDAR